jgi:O-antigen ligase
MLFLPLAALILYSLWTFGATVPANWYLLSILMSVSTGGYLIGTVLRRDTWHRSVLASFFLLVLFLAVPRSEVVLSILFGFLAWVAASHSPERHTLRFFQLLMVAGVAEAVLGLIQNFISPGWIFGYINSFYPVSGTLINHNHFAGLLEMLIPVAFGLAYASARRFDDLARSYLYLLAGALMGLAVFLSASRMGILTLLLTVLFLGILVRVRKSQRRLAVGFTATIMGLVLAGALFAGIDVVIQRYSFLLGNDGILREGRVLVYRDTMNMIIAHPWGLGIGSFQDRFREYQTFRPDLLFDHAHNDYLETVAEWGVPIALAFWIFVLSVWVRAIRLFISTRSPEQCGILLGCIGAISAILIHSLADFNLQIPSNAMLFFAFAGISLAMPVAKEGRTRPPTAYSGCN